MGFIDYVAEYFKGPKGDPGEPGATGPAGPGQIFILSTGTFWENAGGSPIPAGPHVVNFTLPTGASLVSANLDFRSSDPSFTTPDGATMTVARLDDTHYEAVVTLTADLPPATPYSIANLEVLYHLP